MTIINELDSHNSLQELKNDYEKTKFFLEKVRAEKSKYCNELSQVTLNMHELENNYGNLLAENNQLRE